MLLLLLAPRPTHAAELELSLAGPLPFTRLDLDRALALRAPPGAAGTVTVEALGADAVRISHGAVSRTVTLLGMTGTAAARRVALAIADLLEDAVEVPLAPLAPPAPARERNAATSTLTAVRPSEAPASAPAAPPIAPEREARAELALLLAIGAGTNLDRPALSGAIDAALPILGPLQAVLGAGVSWTPPGTVPAGKVFGAALPFRAGLGWSLPSLHLRVRAGAVISVLVVAADDGATSASTTDWIGGAGASALWSFAEWGPVTLIAGLGIDVYATRREYQVHAVPALATERAALWGTIGARTEVGR